MRKPGQQAFCKSLVGPLQDTVRFSKEPKENVTVEDFRRWSVEFDMRRRSTANKDEIAEEMENSASLILTEEDMSELKTVIQTEMRKTEEATAAAPLSIASIGSHNSDISHHSGQSGGSVVLEGEGYIGSTSFLDDAGQHGLRDSSSSGVDWSRSFEERDSRPPDSPEPPPSLSIERSMSAPNISVRPFLETDAGLQPRRGSIESPWQTRNSIDFDALARQSRASLDFDSYLPRRSVSISQTEAIEEKGIIPEVEELSDESPGKEQPGRTSRSSYDMFDHDGVAEGASGEVQALPSIMPVGCLHEAARGVWSGSLSQCGIEPEKEKVNQDSTALRLKLSNRDDRHLFLLCDGHGQFGHDVAQYATAALPLALEAAISEGKPLMEAIPAAYEQVNQDLTAGRDVKVNAGLSGTTAVCVVVEDDKLLIANCGDSRAVLGVALASGGIASRDLSIDQTPFRDDERERLIEAGARILPLPFSEEDPPLVYLKQLPIPGTAFTRSIGDLMVKNIGVVATPELIEHQISEDDSFVVIASDGIWDFITSQEACEIVQQCRNPLQAAHKLISTAWDRWVQWDDRIDDITVTVIFIDVNAGKAGINPWEDAIAEAPKLNAALCLNMNADDGNTLADSEPAPGS